MRIRHRYTRAAWMTAAVSLTAMTAHAQTTPAAGESLEVVVVTGFRASLADALNNKRESNQIIESVSAEDIGKFPDQNVAESLQRLPGVSIDRSNGQGTKARIRGLDQNVTLLNSDIFLSGLELYTQGEGNTRETDSLESIPSELLGGIDVYKSPNASQSEGGLGGIIDLKTRGPFDLGDTTIAGNLRYADSGEGWEPLGALVFGHQFNDRFAVIASISYDKQKFQTDVLGGQNRGDWDFSDRPDRLTVPDYFAPEYRYTTDREEERERLGFSLGAAFRPSESTELQAMWFHSDLDILTQEASIKFPFGTESPGLDTTQPYEIDSNGVLVHGTVIANSAEAISFVKNTDIKSDNFQLTFKWDNGGPWSASAAAAYSKAEQESQSANNDVRYTQYAVRGTNGVGFAPNAAAPANYRFTYDAGNGEVPSFTLVDHPDLYTNPANGFFKSHWAFGDTTDAENWSVRGDARFSPTFITAQNVSFSGGLRLTSREIDYEFGRYLADYSGKGELDGSQYGQNWTPWGYFQDGAIGYKSCEIPASAGANFAYAPCERFGNSPALITPYQTFNSNPGRVETINGFWGSGNAGTSSVLVQNRSQMGNALAWIQALYPDTPFQFFPSPLETFRVEEKTTAGYLMADIGNPEDRYHVNVGARILRTELTVDQNAASNPNPTFWGTDSWNGVLKDFETRSIERSYTDILPSANVVLDVTESSKVRASAARVVARQDLFQLGRGFETNFTRDSDAGSPTFNLFRFTNGSSGNPELDPYRATQFDVSYEYYFGSQGLVAVTPFWKEVDSFITTVTQSVFVMDQAGGREGPVQVPINGEGGSIKGIELSAQYAFDSGFGFNVNYTYSDSESGFFNDYDSNLPIPGVPEHAFNAQVYYQNYGFEARLSYGWRDESFDSNFGFPDATFDGAGNATSITRTLGVWNRDYGQLDAQVAYQFTDYLGVTLEAINLTEEDASQYLQFDNLPFAFDSGSRRILVGVRGRF
ncbi:MAG TPA: TonB-dependent receptor [Povalibacter sp.]|uniref:TonB-dependent receptor n=1 Tax=Povalibacter sp. TaxID=1962978 RepID=UPI002C0B253B|nr:TonB-dependent receptor [Povalibacter sp.]HMN44059.1 TonB-dependent receptor [Povalibacter sp.]